MVYALLNNELLEEDKVSIPIDDRGFLYGEAAFTTIRLYDGKPLALFDTAKDLMQHFYLQPLILILR